MAFVPCSLQDTSFTLLRGDLPIIGKGFVVTEGVSFWTFVATEPFYAFKAFDEYFWLLWKLPSVTDCRALDAFSGLTLRYPSLFAPHLSIDYKGITFYACAKNHYDLEAYLYLGCPFLREDLAKYIVEQAFKIFRIMTKENIYIPCRSLAASLQLWRVSDKEFDLHFGCFGEFQQAPPELQFNAETLNLKLFRQLVSDLRQLFESSIFLKEAQELLDKGRLDFPEHCLYDRTFVSNELRALHNLTPIWAPNVSVAPITDKMTGTSVFARNQEILLPSSHQAIDETVVIE